MVTTAQYRFLFEEDHLIFLEHFTTPKLRKLILQERLSVKNYWGIFKEAVNFD